LLCVFESDSPPCMKHGKKTEPTLEEVKAKRI